MESTFHATTILAIRRDDRAVLAGDGQVTLGNTVVKQTARKIRRLYNDNILAGFAGSAADSFALFSRFEAKLDQYRGNLERSAVELAKAYGCRVVAAVSTEEKGEVARKHGADEVVIYPRAPFDKDTSKQLASDFKAAVGPNGADIVYDIVGGDYSEPALRAIAWEGRFLVIGFPEIGRAHV